MANLAFVKIAPSKEFQDLSVLSGVTFVSGTSYVLQIKGVVQFCEKSSLPSDPEEGFTWNDIEPFTYDAKGENLYVRVIAPFDATETATINIAD